MPRTQVFISYSHKDKRWLERLQVHLKPFERLQLLYRWDDTRIKAGSNWRTEIDTALAAAKVAVLVVSADFLASDFIANNELPPLFKAAEDQGAVILPVIVSASVYSDTNLAQFQAVNDPSKPLNGMNKAAQEKIFVQVAHAVRDAVPNAEPAMRSSLSNLPERNPLFTGREDILAGIERALKSPGRAALSGIGGAGKTQTAIEYAHRHVGEYKEIFWVSAATQETLISGYAAVAGTDDKDQMKAVEAAKNQLGTRNDWLLILDNADDIEIVRPFIVGKGHVLLTTRAHALGTTAKCIDVKEMDADEGTELLLRRSRIEKPRESDRNAARAIATNLLDGLPLALDQAGAYIEETGCGLDGYLALYRKHAPKLLARRGQAPEHPDPVTTTWSLSFENIEKANPAAADLLWLCAFLAPDAIPIEILGTQISDEFELENALAEILKYSLLSRDATTRTVEIHRLVQQALKHGMAADDQRAWAERAINGVAEVFPDPEFRAWPDCERLLPQAFAAASLITEHKFEFSAAARLLNAAGLYLYHRARYSEAEPLYKNSLSIYERLPDEKEVPAVLNHLAILYDTHGEYDKAVPLYQRALVILEKTLGPDDPRVATTLSNLAEVYRARGEYDKAEPLHKRALAVRETAVGSHHPDVALSLNNLGVLHHQRGEYEKAEPLYQKALAIREEVLTPDHPDIAQSLNNLASLLHAHREYDKAESLYQRAIAIDENAYGPDHPEVATDLINYSHLLEATNRSQQAAELRARAAAIRAKFK